MHMKGGSGMQEIFGRVFPVSPYFLCILLATAGRELKVGLGNETEDGTWTAAATAFCELT